MTKWIDCSKKSNKKKNLCKFRKSSRGNFIYFVKEVKIPKNSGFWATIPQSKRGKYEINRVLVVAYKKFL